MPEIMIVLLAGLAAGALNAVGGGGTFVALPALVAVGLPPVTANAAATVALVPGSVASAWVYRRELTPLGATSTTALTATSMLGGGLGAVLLLALPGASFDAALPWLLAFGTVVLAFGRTISRALSAALRRSVTLRPPAVLIGQFLLAVYGGYFGGAVGILMLALWTIGLGLDTAISNPMRITQVAAVYLTATALFLFASDVLTTPLPLLTMLVGAVAGGFAGAHLARRLPAPLLRGVVLTTAATMTVLYFLRD
ncbi:sulfite exporter TauE/SafE family protein [Micromonospora sp. NBC_01796]|uniref:sulfite exporter TauE/SafE family protein n=1 Tax=Micromonospora sp. NBC_01796 TaxID=2975987 RepID=UPI002DDC7012|nr:sulfite exporter TauE/SafE family protein [Micromonospora sp. NBC_01796]WSA86676.1 sulfite exporter TauE/SafE family protein [Micromonospora sp. NBC_01796]